MTKFRIYDFEFVSKFDIRISRLWNLLGMTIKSKGAEEKEFENPPTPLFQRGNLDGTTLVEFWGNNKIYDMGGGVMTTRLKGKRCVPG